MSLKSTRPISPPTRSGSAAQRSACGSAPKGMNCEPYTRNSLTLLTHASIITRLESELMTAKTTMVKESVRLAYGELWQYHCDGGNLAEANKTLLKSRDFCSAPNHVMDLCIRSALTSLDSGDCRAVQQHASKADQPEADAATKNRLKLFLGIGMYI